MATLFYVGGRVSTAELSPLTITLRVASNYCTFGILTADERPQAVTLRRLRLIAR